MHRVVLSPRTERTSLVFFYYPSYDAPMPFSTDPPSDEKEKAEAAAAAAAAAAAGCTLGYNTLLDLAGGSGVVARPSSSLTFGEHLRRKWAGVATNTMTTTR